MLSLIYELAIEMQIILLDRNMKRNFCSAQFVTYFHMISLPS